MKNPTKKDKIVISICIAIIVYMLIMFGIELYRAIDYEKAKESGNQRWLQVEKRIVSIENKVDKLEVIIDGNYCSINN